MSDGAKRVVYAAPRAQRAAHAFSSAFDFETTLSRIRAAIAQLDMWVIHEINPQALLLRGGYEMLQARQLLFFHPRFMVRLLETNPDGIIEAPLKIIVTELPDGSVCVRHPNVAMSFAAHPGLAPMGEELAAHYVSLRAAITSEHALIAS